MIILAFKDWFGMGSLGLLGLLHLWRNQRTLIKNLNYTSLGRVPWVCWVLHTTVVHETPFVGLYLYRFGWKRLCLHDIIMLRCYDRAYFSLFVMSTSRPTVFYCVSKTKIRGILRRTIQMFFFSCFVFFKLLFTCFHL